MIDLVIRDGLVVTPDDEGVLDVGIAGEEIAFVSEPASDRRRRAASSTRPA